MDIVRPVAPDTAQQKVARLFSGITPGRVLSTSLAVLAVSIGSWWLLRTPAPAVERSLPTAPRAALVAPPSTVSAEVVVQMAGAVVRPGVYRLPTGSRVADLVAAAGGPTDGVDASSLPLAAKVNDGQRIYLSRPGEVAPSTAGANGIAGDKQPLDLNAASTAELDALPGVGPSTAAAIVAYREAHGSFRSVDGLLEVKGLGAAKVDALRPLVRV